MNVGELAVNVGRPVVAADHESSAGLRLPAHQARETATAGVATPNIYQRQPAWAAGRVRRSAVPSAEATYLPTYSHDQIQESACIHLEIT